MTISDIAKMAGVSSAAVSRYLNGGPLSEQKRAVIHEVVEKTGYRPDTAAQTLRTGKVNQVGVIAPSIGSQSVGQITAGIASELDAKSYLMLLGNTELDAQRELGYLTAMQRNHVAGIILLGTEMTESDYDLFAHCPVPLVLVDGQSDNHFIESILFSNEGSAYRAVRSLVRRGHRQIGYLAGKLRIRNFPLRERGYERALAEVGVQPQAKFRVSLGTDKMENAYRDMLEWLQREPEMPTAFFAENDALAVGAMKALAECGFDIPGDVSIVGFDDVEFAGVAHPALTTVHVPRTDLGRIAVRKLIEQVEQPTEYTCVTHLSTRFVERESVRSLL